MQNPAYTLKKPNDLGRGNSTPQHLANPNASMLHLTEFGMKAADGSFSLFEIEEEALHNCHVVKCRLIIRMGTILEYLILGSKYHLIYHILT